MSFLSSLAIVGQVIGAILMFVPGMQPIGLALMAGSNMMGAYDSRREARRAQRRAREAYNNSLQDRLETIQAETAARRVILGRRRVGGVIGFAGTTGTNKEKLYMVVLLAGHRVQSIDTIYFGETELTLDGSGNVTTDPYQTSSLANAQSSVTTNSSGNASITLPNTPEAGSVLCTRLVERQWEPLSGGVTISGATITITGGPTSTVIRIDYQWNKGTFFAKIHKFDGTQTAVPSVLSAAFPTQWTAAQKLLGQAFLVCELTYSTDVFPNGLQNVSAVVQGALVYDPRTSTTAFSENPALLLAHYATHPLGGKLAWSAVDTAMLIEAANRCDSTTTMYVTTDSSGTVTSSGAQTLFKAAMLVEGSSRPADVLDELAEAMAGRWAISNGKLLMRAAMLRSTADTITADYLAGGVSIKAQRARQELSNTVRGTYSSDQAAWNTTQFPQVQDATLLAAHGAELVMETQFEAVGRGPQCLYLSTIALREMRQAMTVTLTCNMRAYPLQVFDVVAVTLARYGWTAKLFEIVERSWTPDGIRLTLRETAAAIYDQSLTFTVADAAPNTSLPDPLSSASVYSLGAASGVSTAQNQSDGTVVPRILVTWTAMVYEAVRYGGSIEVRYGEAAADEANWTSIEVAGSNTQVYLSPVTEGQTYLIKARAKTPLARGPWCQQISHRVVSYGLSGASPARWHNGSGVSAVWVNASATQIFWKQGDSSAYTLPPGSVGAVQVQDGSIDTEALTDWSATDVLTQFVSSFSYDAPDIFNQLVTTVTYPPVSFGYRALLHFSADYTYTWVSSGETGAQSKQIGVAAQVNGIAINQVKLLELPAVYTGDIRTGTMSATFECAVSVGSQSNVFQFFVNKTGLNSGLSLANVSIRVEIVKK